jgi:hypothetical protein
MVCAEDDVRRHQAACRATGWKLHRLISPRDAAHDVPRFNGRGQPAMASGLTLARAAPADLLGQTRRALKRAR